MSVAESQTFLLAKRPLSGDERGDTPAFRRLHLEQLGFFKKTVNFSWIHAGIFFLLLSAFKIHTLYTHLTCDHKIYI